MKKHACSRIFWCVTVRHGNFSSFNGYKFSPSDYSQVTCLRCGNFWRTKGDYVRFLPDSMPEVLQAARILRNEYNGIQDAVRMKRRG